MTFTYTFSGRVHPERTYVTLGPIPRCTIETRLADAVLVLDAHIVINNAQILVVANCHQKIEDLETLRNVIESVVQGAVDAFGYTEGRGYDVEITSVITSTGEQWTVFGVEIAAIQASKGDRPVTFGELYTLLTTPDQSQDETVSFGLMQLRIALGDLREAVRSPNLTAFFCYRAIETLRQCYLDPDKRDDEADRRDSWQRMGNELRIDRSWIGQIQEASILERHGSHKAMSGEQRVGLMLHTWKVVDRFIMSARNKFQPLSEEILSIPGFILQEGP